MESYCDRCRKLVTGQVITRQEEYKVRGEAIRIDGDYAEAHTYLGQVLAY